MFFGILSSVTTFLLPTAFGFLIYGLFCGWGMLQELSSPSAPARNATGSLHFLLGQAFALIAATAVAGILGILLRSIVSGPLYLRCLSLLLIVILFLLQSVWTWQGRPLEKPAEVLEASFRGGRDLILRHVLGLFLVFGGLVSISSAEAVRHQLLGIFIGWATINARWGAPLQEKLFRTERRLLSAAAMLLTAVFAMKLAKILLLLLL